MAGGGFSGIWRKCTLIGQLDDNKVDGFGYYKEVFLEKSGYFDVWLIVNMNILLGGMQVEQKINGE